MPALVSALNSVDLPTLGKPTMPHFNAMGETLGDAPDAAQRWDYRKPYVPSGAAMAVLLREITKDTVI